MVKNEVIEEIIENIKAGFPGIHIVSNEYLRLDDLVSAVADKLGFKKKEWNLGLGQLNSNDGHRMQNNGKNRTIIEFLDEVSGSLPNGKLLLYIKNAKLVMEGNKEYIARLQQTLIQIQKYFKGQSCIIYTSEEKYIPPELSQLVYLIEYGPPDNNELTEIIESYITEHEYKISSEKKQKFISICAGLDKESILRVLSKINSSKNHVFDEKGLSVARNAKEQKVSKSGYIEMVPLKESFDDLGGLEELKLYLRKKKQIIDDLVSATRLGILPPKGILLAGLPGCGKSLAAKSTAYLFNFPLLRIDIGSLMGKYVGESENNLKNALSIVEHANPCVLWLDEIEKAFSGTEGDSGGSGVTNRMFGQFLTWMQEKKGTIFVIATANNISKVPPELWRKGRFDECFFVDLPNKSEREQILKIYLDKISDKESSSISIQEIAEYTDGYSGADIQALINDALETSFIENRKFNSSTIRERTKKITPLKIMLGDKIKEYDALRQEFGIRLASWTPEEKKAFINNLINDAKNPDPTVRERTAKDTLCPPNILEDLANDKFVFVREAVFKNPECPQNIIENYLKGNKPYPKTSSNSDAEKYLYIWTHGNLYDLALLHPNTSGEIIADLYERQIIDKDALLNVISSRKFIENDLASLFKLKEVKIPDETEWAVVRKYYVSVNSKCDKGSTLADLDDMKGSCFPLICPFDAIVKDITVPINEKIDRDKALFYLYDLEEEVTGKNGGYYGRQLS